MLHWFSRTVASTFLLVCVFLALLAVCSGKDFSVEWSPEGVREYTSSNPLVVQLGDNILFRCPTEGNFTYSNLWVQAHEQQIEDCDCLAVVGETCDPLVAKNAQCIPNTVDPTLHIIRNDAELNSVLNFRTGERYYLASYAPEQTLAGAYSPATMGGQCLDGLRMVMEVVDTPTQPTTTATVQTTMMNHTEPPSSDDVHTTTNPFVGTTSESSKESTNGTEETVVEILLLPSQSLRDWHVVVIVVLGAAMLSLVLVLVIGGVSAMLYRRRGRLVVNPGGGSIDCKLDMAAVASSPDKSSYPVDVFDDPIDKVPDNV